MFDKIPNIVFYDICFQYTRPHAREEKNLKNYLEILLKSAVVNAAVVNEDTLNLN